MMSCLCLAILVTTTIATATENSNTDNCKKGGYCPWKDWVADSKLPSSTDCKDFCWAKGARWSVFTEGQDDPAHNIINCMCFKGECEDWSEANLIGYINQKDWSEAEHLANDKSYSTCPLPLCKENGHCSIDNQVAEASKVTSPAKCKDFCEQSKGARWSAFSQSDGHCMCFGGECLDSVPKRGYFTCPVDLWETISEDHACEGNNECNIDPIFMYMHVNTLELCKTKCQEKPFCRAIDYFTSSQVCSLYDSACQQPNTASKFSLPFKGASSHKLTRSNDPWEVIGMKHFCGGGLDSGRVIKKLSFEISPVIVDPYGLTLCKQKCQNTAKCQAIDYDSSHGWCFLLNSDSCPPDGLHDKVISCASSYKLEKTHRKTHLIQQADSRQPENLTSEISRGFSVAPQVIVALVMMCLTSREAS